MNRLFRIKQGILCELFVVLVATSFLIYDKVSERTLATIGQTSEVGVTTDITGEEKAGTSGESSDSENQSTNLQDTDKEEDSSKNDEKKEFIKWVEFNVSYEALNQAYLYDVETYEKDVHVDWIELLAYLGATYGGVFGNYKKSDMSKLVERLQSKEENMTSITADMKYYSYYLEAYTAVLGGLVGEYEIEQTKDDTSEELVWVKKYGLKGFLPIAKNFPYSDYDDFGVSRSYGYKRRHLGHDMIGQVGTPIVAVESGYVEAIGWNQYGGWRLGIRSFDGKRYYYYAHLRKNFPYNKALKEGSIVQAGDVIGYLGRTGYSATENVNNIETSHLHIGLQLIFDESQKEGNNEIWVDCYNLIRFLYQNRSETVKNTETKEWYRIYNIKDPAVEEYKKTQGKVMN